MSISRFDILENHLTNGLTKNEKNSYGSNGNAMQTIDSRAIQLTWFHGVHTHCMDSKLKWIAFMLYN